MGSSWRGAGIGVAIAILGIATSCSSPTDLQPEIRELGLVVTPEDGYFLDLRETPRAWVVEGRRTRIEVTTIGPCAEQRPDWDVTTREGFVFILPYTIRETGCEGPPSPDRGGRPIFLHTDTLEVEFRTALEADVRIVSGDGRVIDLWVDFHPGWPPEGGGDGGH